MKTCPSCQLEKSLDEFYPDKHKGRSTYCKTCTKARNAKWIKNNRDKHRVYQSKRKYKPRDRRQYYLANKKEHLARGKVWRAANADKVRNAYLLRKYGITNEQYNELLLRQNGCCAICLKTPEELGHRLHVDHNHRTREVRGLLCNFDNHRFVGRHTDPGKFERAAAYLRQGAGLYVPENRPKRRRKKRR